MAYNHEYPYVDPNRYNSDWLLNKVKELEGEMSTFEALNKISFAGEWDITKQYPAWTIVNTNNGTEGYISIQPVPAGVLISDTNYWVSVVNYTATIADLQNRVVALEEEVAELTAGKKYIFLGDSYGTVSDDWISQTVDMLGLTAADYYRSAIGGAGFAYGQTFLQQLTALYSTITDKDSITDIVIGGGFNDRSVATATVKTAISNFMDYVRANYPNASVHVGFIGWSFNSEFVSELRLNNVLNTYKGCAEFGATYISHSDEVMHDFDLFLEEDQSPYTLYLGYQYVHPNSDGGNAIARCIINYLRCGAGVSYDTVKAVTPDLSSGVNIQVGTLNLVMTKNGNNVSVSKDSTNLTVLKFDTAVNVNASPIEIGFLRSGLIAGRDTTKGDSKITTIAPIIGFAVNSSNENIVVPGELYFANNRLYLSMYAEGLTSVTLIALYGSYATFNTSDI